MTQEQYSTCYLLRGNGSKTVQHRAEQESEQVSIWREAAVLVSLGMYTVLMESKYVCAQRISCLAMLSWAHCPLAIHVSCCRFVVCTNQNVMILRQPSEMLNHLSHTLRAIRLRTLRCVAQLCPGALLTGWEGFSNNSDLLTTAPPMTHTDTSFLISVFNLQH